MAIINIISTPKALSNMPKSKSILSTTTTTTTQYDKKTRDELLSECRERNIAGYSGKTRAGIISMLTLQQKPPSPQPVPPPPIHIPLSLPLPLPLKLKPLIKWSGGKGDEIPQFEMHIPASYDTYIEPFVGGGALFFRLAPKKAVISDVHTELVDLYQNIGQGNAGEIFQFMEQHPNEEATYYDVRDNMVVENSLGRAKRFYYQRKTAFRGMLRYNKNGKFNIPFGRYKTINYSELANAGYETLLSRTTVLNKSFEAVFAEYNSEANFMFLDPPYDSEFTDYGYCQFGKNEHEQLAKCFKQTKIRCLMVIGKTEFIEGLYAGFIVGEYDKQYRFKLYGGRIGDEINTKHLIIKNY